MRLREKEKEREREKEEKTQRKREIGREGMKEKKRKENIKCRNTNRYNFFPSHIYIFSRVP